MATALPIRASRNRSTIRRRRVIALSLLAIALLVVVGGASAALTGFDPFGSDEVGQLVNGAILLPTNQWISPIGDRIEDEHARIQSSTLSPDGQYMAALTWHEFTGYLTIIDLKTGQIVQEEGGEYPNGTLDPEAGEPGEEVAADGPFYSPDGKTLCVPQTGDIAKFTVDPETGMVSNKVIVPMPKAAHTKAPEYNKEPASPGEALPSGMAFSADGSKLYVALNGANTLAVLNTATDEVEKQIPVGNAPRQVVIDGNTAYVSNEGGHPAKPGRIDQLHRRHRGPGEPGHRRRRLRHRLGRQPRNGNRGRRNPGRPAADGALPRRRSALRRQLQRRQPLADRHQDQQGGADGQHQSAARRQGRQLRERDLDARPEPRPGQHRPRQRDRPLQVRRPDQGRSRALGWLEPRRQLERRRSPGARPSPPLASPSPGPPPPIKDPLSYEGLMPTDWYPVDVQPDPALGAGTIVVTNARGIGDRGPKEKICKGPETSPATECATGFNTYDETGTVTKFTMPSHSELAHDTATVFTDNNWKNVPAINSGAGDTVPHVIPTHLGGHSPIKHVFVIVKENRTYDQDLGDLGEGNGDPELAQFGAEGDPQPARVGEALRRPRQLLRRGDAVGGRAQLDRPGRGQRLHRKGVRRLLPVIPGRRQRRARLPARRLPLERRREGRPERESVR